MLLAVAGFEFRQQLRSHVFWVVAAISALMVFGSVSVDELRVGLTDPGLRNGVQAVARTHLVWSLFYMFTTAALVADAVLRDDLTGFGPVIRATPVPRTSYRLGRFLGATAAVLACFVTVPLGLVAGAHAPWVDPTSVGPTAGLGLAFSLVVLAIPNLIVSAALGFGLATMTGSMGGALLGAVVLLVAYGLGTATDGTGAALLEPFGFSAYGQAIAALMPAERDAAVPWLDATLLANRVLWLVLAAGVVLWVCRRPDQPPRAGRASEDRFEAIVARRPVGLPAPAPTRSAARILACQLAARTRLEIAQLVVTPAFGVLLLLGMINAAGALWRAADPRGGPLTTSVLVVALVGSFQIVPIVVAGFFAGELLWNERDRRVHDLVWTAPFAGPVVVLPKLLALATTLILLAVTAAVTAAAIQLVRHGAPLDIFGYLSWSVLPSSVDWILFAILALFLQSASRSKVAGWGWTVLYLIVSLTLQKLGFVDPRYRYGLYPGWPLPAGLSGAAHVGWFRLYWGAAATVLAVVACWLGGRGLDGPLGGRLRRLRSVSQGPGRLIVAAATLTFLAAGTWLAFVGD